MICKNCGREIDDNSYTCEYCGVATNIDYSKYKEDSNDKIGCFFMILSFVFPLIGFILYFAWKNCRPASAKVAINCAWVSTALAIIGKVIDYLL